MVDIKDLLKRILEADSGDSPVEERPQAPFDIKYKNQIRSFNARCGALESLLDSVGTSYGASKPDDIQKLLERLDQLESYISESNITEQPVVKQKMSALTQRISSKKEADMSVIRDTCEFNKSVSRKLRWLEKYEGNIERKLRVYNKLANAWRQTANFTKKIKSFLNLYKSIPGRKEKAANILAMYKEFADEIEKLELNAEDHTDHIYDIAVKYYSRKIRLRSGDESYVAEKFKRHPGHKDKLQGLFVSALFNQSSLKKINIPRLSGNFWFYKTKDKKISIGKNNCEDAFAEAENCLIKIQENNKEAGRGAKNTGLTVNINNGSLLEEAVNCSCDVKESKQNGIIAKNAKNCKKVYVHYDSGALGEGAEDCRFVIDELCFISEESLGNQKRCKVFIKLNHGVIGENSEECFYYIEHNHGLTGSQAKNCEFNVAHNYACLLHYAVDCRLTLIDSDSKGEVLSDAVNCKAKVKENKGKLLYEADNCELDLEESLENSNVLEKAKNCKKISIITNQGDAGAKARNSSFVVDKNYGDILSKAVSCELKLNNSAGNVLYQAKKCNAQVETNHGTLLEDAEECELGLGVGEKDSKTAINAKKCKKIKVTESKGMLGNGAQESEFEIKISRHLSLSDQKSCNAVIHEAHAAVGKRSKDGIYKIGLNGGPDSFDKSMNNKVNIVENRAVLGIINNSEVRIDELFCDIKTGTTSKYYIEKSHVKLKPDPGFYLKKDGKYVSVKEEYDRMLRELNEHRKQKFSFWQELYQILKRERDSIKNELENISKKRFECELELKGLLWNKKEKCRLPYRDLILHKVADHVTVTLNISEFLGKKIVKSRFSTEEQNNIEETYKLHKSYNLVLKQNPSIENQLSNHVQLFSQVFSPTKAKEYDLLASAAEKFFSNAQFNSGLKRSQNITENLKKNDFRAHYSKYKQEGISYIQKLTT